MEDPSLTAALKAEVLRARIAVLETALREDRGVDIARLLQRVAELEAAATMHEAARALMLARITSQESTLDELRARLAAAETRANRLGDTCGELQARNDRLMR